MGLTIGRLPEDMEDDAVAALKRLGIHDSSDWRETSVWLPVAFQPPLEPAMESGGWPVFLGSCQGLLADLAEVQRLSDSGLGSTPDGYDKMRADYQAFFQSGFELSDEHSIIQRVWRGLHDGAELAIRQSTPLLGMD